MRRCDALRAPCDLKTELEANLAYYEPFGFRVVREERLGIGGVRVRVWTRSAG